MKNLFLAESSRILGVSMILEDSCCLSTVGVISLEGVLGASLRAVDRRVLD